MSQRLTVGKGDRKIQPVGFQSRMVSHVDTDSSEPSYTYASITKSATYLKPKTKTTPSTPHKQSTQSRVKCFSSGREKFEQLLEFKKRLDQEQKSTPPPVSWILAFGNRRSTPSSPKARIIHIITQEDVSASINNDSPETKKEAHPYSGAVNNFVTKQFITSR